MAPSVRDGVVVDGWEADGRWRPRHAWRARPSTANRLVLAAGPWLPALVPALAPLLRVERNVVHWFRPEADTAAGVRAFGPDGLPVLVIEDRARAPALRPAVDARARAATSRTASSSPATMAACSGRSTRSSRRRRPTPRRSRADVARYLPGLRPEPIRSAMCAYTNTPDGHFLIDRHPGHHAVILVSPCSGHGFKFAPVVGAIAADFADDVNVHGNLPPFAFRAV